MIKRLLLLFVLACLLGACQKYETNRRLSKFDTIISSYYADLRWSRFDQAAGSHRDRDGKSVEINRDKLKPIRVTGYSMREKIISPELDTATVIVDMAYYNDDYGSLRNVELVHEWWYNEERKRWYLESEFPVFK